MTRINFPIAFLKQMELLKDIIKQYNASGPGNVLEPFLIENNITILDAEAACVNAFAFHKQQETFEKKAEIHFEQRDLLFKVVFTHMRDCARYLKNLYRHNFHELGAWGLPIVGDNAIHWPPDFLSRYNIWKTFKEKFDTYPAGTSPLQPFLVLQDWNMGDDNTKANNAYEQNGFAIRAKNDAELFTEQRDLIWNVWIKNMRDIGDFLKNLLITAPHALGTWGFTIDSSRKEPKLRTSTIHVADKKTISNIVRDSVLTNISTTTLNIYKGRKVTTTFVAVLAGKTLAMTKGYSRITVVNPSTTTIGKLTLLRY